MKRKLTYELCLSVAKTCKTSTELKIKDESVYEKARDKGWLDNWGWIKKITLRDYTSSERWTEEKIRAIASKYEYLSDFKRENYKCYNAAFNKGIIYDLGLKRNERNNGSIYWTRDRVQEVADECIKNGMSLEDFKLKHGGAWNRAKRDGYINELGFKRRTTIYNGSDYIYSYEFGNSVYVGRTIHLNKRDKAHHEDKNDSVFKYADKNGLKIPDIKILKVVNTVDEGLYWEDWYLNDYIEKGWIPINKAKTGIKSGSRGGCRGRYKWTEKNIRKLVKEHGYSTINQMAQEEPGAYSAALRMGLINELFPMKNGGRLTYLYKNGKIKVFNSLKNCARYMGIKYTTVFARMVNKRTIDGSIGYL